MTQTRLLPRSGQNQRGDSTPSGRRTLLVILACCLTILPILAAGGAAFAEQNSAEAETEGPQIVLYQTSWCGYCRKTRQLLEDLDASFVMLDIEKDREAYNEYRRKGAGYRGVPLTDVGGNVVRGYQPERIRNYVRILQEQEKREQARREAEEAGESNGRSADDEADSGS